MSESLNPGTSLGELLGWASRVLSLSGSSTPRLDAEVLLASVLSITRAQLYAHWDQHLETRQIGRYVSLVQRREAHEPVAYLIGQRAFYDVELFVDPGVLIPRPETEHIVDEAIVWAKDRPAGLRVLDVGTGSGALAVVLARRLPGAQVWAADISQQALAVAARNVRRYQLQDRALLVCSDLASAFGGNFDLIVANLPYVPRAEMAALPPDVAEYEPRLALEGGEDGLDLVRRLLTQASGLLRRPGLLLAEIDPRQAQTIQGWAKQCWPGAEIQIIHDYAEWPRVLKVALE